MFLEYLGNVNSENTNVFNEIEVVIHSKDIQEVEVSGLGSLNMETINSDTLNVESYLVGKVFLKGNVNYFYLENTGLGIIDAKELKANEMNIENYGLGKVSVFALERLAIIS